jgi:hypothetical protein
VPPMAGLVHATPKAYNHLESESRSWHGTLL